MQDIEYTEFFACQKQGGALIRGGSSRRACRGKKFPDEGKGEEAAGLIDGRFRIGEREWNIILIIEEYNRVLCFSQAESNGCESSI